MRILKYSLTLMALLTFGGAIYQFTSEQLDRNNAPGQFHQIGENTYHLFCEGVNEPTLLFESGRWGWYADWVHLWKLLPSSQRKCTYDRLGLGWTSKNSYPTNSRSAADELNRLLNEAGVDGKLIVVGHSLGGLYTRRFFELFPERVSGLVLLDSTHEEAPMRMTYPSEDLTEIKLCRAIAWTGVLRLFDVMDMLVPEKASPAHTLEILSVANRTHFCAGLIEAAEGIELELEGSAPPRSLGKLPLVVVRRGKTVDDYAKLEGENRRLFKINEPVWHELQEELAGLSSQSRLLIAYQSGHQIQADEPESVVEAIDIILEWISDE